MDPHHLGIGYDAPGLAVVIGTLGGKTVWIGWAREGEELDLLDEVQLGSQERLYVHHVWPADYGDTVAFRFRHFGSATIGQWFKRSRSLAIYANMAWERAEAGELVPA